MGLTMRERHAIVRELSSRFQRATKKERGQILNDFRDTCLSGSSSVDIKLLWSLGNRVITGLQI